MLLAIIEWFQWIRFLFFGAPPVHCRVYMPFSKPNRLWPWTRAIFQKLLPHWSRQFLPHFCEAMYINILPKVIHMRWKFGKDRWRIVAVRGPDGQNDGWKDGSWLFLYPPSTKLMGYKNVIKITSSIVRWSALYNDTY